MAQKILLLIIVSLTFASCGKRAALMPDKPDTFPNKYPAESDD